MKSNDVISKVYALTFFNGSIFKKRKEKEITLLNYLDIQLHPRLLACV